MKDIKRTIRLKAAPAVVEPVSPEVPVEDQEEAKKGPIQFPDESFETIMKRIARVPKPEKD